MKFVSPEMELLPDADEIFTLTESGKDSNNRFEPNDPSGVAIW